MTHTATHRVIPGMVPRGWTEAWTWTCACGAESWSMMRDRRDSMRDHQDQHLAALPSDDPTRGRPRPERHHHD